MWTLKKGRKLGGPVESHPIAQNENLVSSMPAQDLSDPYRNPCPSSTPPRRPTMRYPPLRLLQATILSECPGAQESLRHYQSPLLSHQKWCKLYTDCNPRSLLDTAKETITHCCKLLPHDLQTATHFKCQHTSLCRSLSFGANKRTGQRGEALNSYCV